MKKGSLLSGSRRSPLDIMRPSSVLGHQSRPRDPPSLRPDPFRVIKFLFSAWLLSHVLVQVVLILTTQTTTTTVTGLKVEKLLYYLIVASILQGNGRQGMPYPYTYHVPAPLPPPPPPPIPIYDDHHGHHHHKKSKKKKKKKKNKVTNIFTYLVDRPVFPGLHGLGLGHHGPGPWSGGLTNGGFHENHHFEPSPEMHGPYEPEMMNTAHPEHYDHGHEFDGPDFESYHGKSISKAKRKSKKHNGLEGERLGEASTETVRTNEGDDINEDSYEDSREYDGDNDSDQGGGGGGDGSEDPMDFYYITNELKKEKLFFPGKVELKRKIRFFPVDKAQEADLPEPPINKFQLHPFAINVPPLLPLLASEQIPPNQFALPFHPSVMDQLSSNPNLHYTLQMATADSQLHPMGIQPNGTFSPAGIGSGPSQGPQMAANGGGGGGGNSLRGMAVTIQSRIRNILNFNGRLKWTGLLKKKSKDSNRSRGNGGLVDHASTSAGAPPPQAEVLGGSSNLHANLDYYYGE